MRSVYTLTRGRKAALVSLLFHGLVIAVFSWLFPLTQVKEVEPEPYLELELAEDGGGGGGGMALGSLDQMTDNNDEFSPDESRDNEAYQANLSNPLPQKVTRKVHLMSGVSGSQGYSAGNSSGGGTGGGIGTGTESGQGSQSGSGAGSSNGAGQGSGSAVPGGIIPPSIVSSPEPSYPMTAREEGRQGTVRVRIQILTDGLPGTVEVAVSSGYTDLDAAAVAGVKKWRFTPAKYRSTGQAFVSYPTRDVVFNLRK
ncbi:protein TonB [Propionispora hippei DSM 15287]|uniref:Protein TonB n=1 Tax=Propionispora hippei DSM 15287 TaxID=1123003 RepID=A0A1M6KZM0_9FIRM|nr:protein TonB [Propionispora hippei DSM 15287]